MGILTIINHSSPLDPHLRTLRRQLRGLHHHRVARGQCWDHWVDRHLRGMARTGMKSWGKPGKNLGKSREDLGKSGETVGFCDILVDFGKIQATFWRHVGCFWGNLDRFFFGNIWETCFFLGGIWVDLSGTNRGNTIKLGWTIGKLGGLYLENFNGLV